jgi:hypothetical protein
VIVAVFLAVSGGGDSSQRKSPAESSAGASRPSAPSIGIPSRLPSELPSSLPSKLPSWLPSELPSDVPGELPSGIESLFATPAASP